MLSLRAKKISLSPTLKISAKAKAMKSAGVDVIDLSVGEPDFPTPSNIKEAAKKAIDDNFTKYTANNGILSLRQAIAKKLKEENGVEYSPDEIIVSSGAKNCLYNLSMTLFDEGDEVIILAPYWVSYPEMVKLSAAKPVIVKTEEKNGFKITPEELEGAFSPSTKAFILNNPSNPTGAAYTKEELLDLAEVVEDKQIVVIADEIYEKLIYDDFKFVSFASLSEKTKNFTVVVNGVSKSFSMTGWRIGYAAGPKELINGMSNIQSHSTSNASSVSQMAALEALQGPEDEVKRMVKEFGLRKDYMLDCLSHIPNISCYHSQGAFYLFPNISSYIGKSFKELIIKNSCDLSSYLLEEVHVAVVPGEAFGAEEHIRLSYATSMKNIVTAMDRIEEALTKLR